MTDGTIRIFETFKVRLSEIITEEHKLFYNIKFKLLLTRRDYTPRILTKVIKNPFLVSSFSHVPMTMYRKERRTVRKTVSDDSQVKYKQFYLSGDKKKMRWKSQKNYFLKWQILLCQSIPWKFFCVDNYVKSFRNQCINWCWNFYKHLSMKPSEKSEKSLGYRSVLLIIHCVGNSGKTIIIWRLLIILFWAPFRVQR